MAREQVDVSALMTNRQCYDGMPQRTAEAMPARTVDSRWFRRSKASPE
jgi:hypothetical protein